MNLREIYCNVSYPGRLEVKYRKMTLLLLAPEALYPIRIFGDGATDADVTEDVNEQ